MEQISTERYWMFWIPLHFWIQNLTDFGLMQR